MRRTTPPSRPAHLRLRPSPRTLRPCLAGGALLLAAVLMTACGSPFGTSTPRRWADVEAAAGTPRNAASIQGRADAASTLADDAAFAALTSASGPEDYVALALRRHPLILAAQRRVERQTARRPQVTSLDDPMVMVAPFGEMAQTAAGEVGLMASVSQKLPFPGKLAARGAMVDADAAMAAASLIETRLQVAADTRRAYWSYYFATRAIQTTESSRSLLSQFREVAEVEYKAATRSQQDVLRAGVELGQIETELVLLRQRQQTARSMLNQAMDQPVTAPLPEPDAITPAAIEGDLKDLLAAAAEHNPSLARLAHRLEQWRQQKKLATLGRWPDLTVSFNYAAVDDTGLSMAANGDDQWWVSLGINLPIWLGKYEAAEREAMRGRLEGAAELAAQRNRVAMQVQEAYLKLDAQQRLVELFDHTILPQARQAVEASASAYRAGSIDFLTLIDNWRKLLNFQLMRHRAVADARQALAELDQAVGRENPEVEP